MSSAPLDPPVPSTDQLATDFSTALGGKALGTLQSLRLPAVVSGEFGRTASRQTGGS